MKIPFTALALTSAMALSAATPIAINTDNTSLILNVGENGRLYQNYLGKRLSNPSDYASLPQGAEAYLTHGLEDYFEPALHINHPDGNPSTLLNYVGCETKELQPGVKETIITLADPLYKDEVKLHYTAYAPEDVIVTYAEIFNKENKPIELEKYASSLLHFNRQNYYLTEFSGEWAREAAMTDQPLRFGKKEIDTKLGSRANMIVSPFFYLSLDEPANETHGEVMMGTLGWTGNFRFTFEVDNRGKLRVISGINPYFSRYQVGKGESFRTPEFIFTLSSDGKGQATRNMHDWARRYKLKDGMGERMTLLNNWEATYFDFDEDKLLGLIGEAKELGVDMFLLDDGWFGNKYPRKDDTQGLGDWQETSTKLPNGIGRLTDEAKKQGIKFGLWIEPEMVNPKSELYEKHKDWAITLPNRDTYYFRNQLVLDMSNPDVQDYVFGIVDGLMTKYPDLAYFKWDCNSPITNIYSNYEKGNQQQLYIDHVKGVYKVLDRIKSKYPDLPMMMCSGGGGRTDFKGLEYFTEFWASDNTDPVERLFIQYGFSHIFPVKATSAHVTTWNKDASIKFRTNVAMMGKLGFDLKLADMSDSDVKYVKQAIKNYNRLKPVVLEGDIYRLVSPYDGNHAATQFMSKDGRHGVAYTFDIYPRFDENLHNLKLQGLNPDTVYTVKEIDDRNCNDDHIEGKYSGAYLMNVGLSAFTTNKLNSRVYEIIAE